MFYFVTYLLVILGVISLPLFEGAYSVSVSSFLLFTSVFIFSHFFKKIRLSVLMRKVLLIAFVFLAFLALLLSGKVGQRELVWLVWFLIFCIQIVGVLSYKISSVFLAAFLLSALQIAIAGEFTDSFLFMVFFSLFMMLAPLGFILLLSKLEMREEIFKLLKRKMEFLKWGTLTTANAFFMTALIFLIMPRIKAPLFAIKKEIGIIDKLKQEDPFAKAILKDKTQLRFPDEVSLGMLSEMKEKEERIVMLVETQKPQLWRAKAFNSFKDGEWVISGTKPVELALENRGIILSPFYLDDTLLVKLKPEQFQHQKFYIKDYSQDILLGAYQIIELSELPAKGLKMDLLENIYFDRYVKSGDTYEVISIDKVYPHDYLRSLPKKFPQQMSKLYLEIPEDLDSRFFELAEEVFKNAPANIYDAVVILKEYLNKNYRYALTSTETETISDFLFTTKEGDCEYFATVFALMLRLKGIPTRFVIGFSGGDYDRRTRTSVVYSNHAHAWVEVFFPTLGWLPCDVVPGSPYKNQWADVPRILVPEQGEKATPRDAMPETGTAESKPIPKDVFPEERLAFDKKGIGKKASGKKDAFFEPADKKSAKDISQKEASKADPASDKTYEPKEEVAEFLTQQKQVPREIVFEKKQEDKSKDEGFFMPGDKVAETKALSEDVIEDKIAEEELIEEQIFEEEILEDEVAAEGVSQDKGIDAEQFLEAKEKSSEEELSFDEKTVSEDDSLALAKAKDIEEGLYLAEKVPLEEVDLEAKEPFVGEEEKDERKAQVEALEKGLPEEEMKETEKDGQVISIPSDVFPQGQTLKEEKIQEGILPEEVFIQAEESFPEEELPLEDKAPQDILPEKGILDDILPVDKKISAEKALKEEILKESEMVSGEGILEEELPEEDMLYEATVEEELTEKEAAYEEAAKEELAEKEAVPEEISVEELKEAEVMDKEFSEEKIKLTQEKEEEVFQGEDLNSEEYTETAGFQEEDFEDEIIEEEILEDIIMQEVGFSADSDLEEETLIVKKPKSEEYIEQELGAGVVVAEQLIDRGELIEEEIIQETALLDEELMDEPLVKDTEAIEKDMLLDEEILKEDIVSDKILELQDIQTKDISKLEELLKEEETVEILPQLEEDLESPQEQEKSNQVARNFFNLISSNSIIKLFKKIWNEWIMKFSYYTQRIILDFIKSLFVQIFNFFKAIIVAFIMHISRKRNIYSTLLYSVFAFGLIFNFILKKLRKKMEREQIYKFIPKRILTKEEKEITNFYLYALHLLEKVGYKRLFYLTPREFAQQLFSRGLRISKEFVDLTETFYRISFGQLQVEAAELDRVQEITTTIKEWSRVMRQ